MSPLLSSLYTLQDTDMLVTHENEPYVLKVRDLPGEEKPREKLLKYGPALLSTPELLAIILTVGTKREEVLVMSRRILEEYGKNAIIHQKDPKKIAEALDIPIVKACQIVACLEFGRRYFAKTKGKPLFIRTTQQAWNYLQDMGELPKEHLRGLYLDHHYRLIHDEVISIGSLTTNIIHPREVFRPALEHSASAVILAHNHPSGIRKPSEADITITKQLAEAGKILGIHILDHLVIVRNGFSRIPIN